MGMEVYIPVTAKAIMELIRRNNNAKRPKIRFLVRDTEFTLSVASSNSRFPGTINVVSKGNRWYGRIHENGKYEAASAMAMADHNIVIQVLNAVAADPAKAAAEYGKKTGRCCFCWLPLTDHRSLAVGYGKVCAKNYRLPWDISELEVLTLVPELTEKQAFG